MKVKRALRRAFILFTNKPDYDCRSLSQTVMDQGSTPCISTKNCIILYDLLDQTMNKSINKISKESIDRSVQVSSKIEGLSFLRAKKNKFAINILKKHGRAFSI